MNQDRSSKKDMLAGDTMLSNGRYRIVRHLASGGFGNTYEAVSTSFDAKCAIKEFFMSGVNHRDYNAYIVQVSNPMMKSTFELAKAKFKKEAQRIFKLHNDHIVRVHDLFEENNTVYYVMDYIEGNSLSRLMKAQGHPFSEQQCRDFLIQMTDALRCIHASQIWHMDIKPGNIMMDASGRCTLIDFGASKQTDMDSVGTTSSVIAQTPGYAPMEQVNGNRDYWGPWTDIYALGATIYNLLTGNRPPLSDDISVRQSQAFSFPDTVSQQMRRLVIHMMSPVYVNRPQSVDEVEAELNRVVTPPPADDNNSTVYGSLANTVYNPSNQTTIAPVTVADATVAKPQPKTFKVKGVSFTMIPVEGGTFTMGATAEQGIEAFDDEKPAHRVTLSGYYIGQTEVTQELWQSVMGDNPSCFKGAKLPVEQVSWKDCQKFITKLNSMTGQRFRLPTEAEWEFAARGGSKSRGYKYAGSNNLIDVAWYWQNSGMKFLSGTDDDWDYDKIQSNNCQTHNIATKSPNELGIYDMSGNVWEWCSDWYGENYYAQSPSFNPQGPSSGSNRVHRGGSWYGRARRCRVARRHGYAPDNRDGLLGLRLAL
jgi:formylglycine-generating enzyme required for sulfatase activity